MSKSRFWVSSFTGLAVPGLLLSALSTSARADTFTVTNAQNSGPGSLRLAINSANAKPGSTIAFNLPTTGAQILSPRGVLPSITADGTTIDGFTQPGALKRDNNISQRPVIIDGSQLITAGDLLTVAADDVVITGLTLTQSPRNAVLVDHGTANISNNLIVKNAGAGIQVNRFNGATIVASNASDSNGGLGIDYRKSGDKPGPTNNDAGDSDGIPNRTSITSVKLLNFSSGDPLTQITGTLAGAPSTTYKIEVFLDPNLNASGFGEGLFTLGDTGFLKTDASGILKWSIKGVFAGGGYVSALATQDLGGSRFATGEYARSSNFLLGSQLTISGLPDSLREGAPGATVTISRVTADSSALQILPLSSPEGQLNLPPVITIPPDQKSATFILEATDDAIPDGDVPVALGFFATGFTPTGGIVRVRDNEGPTLSIKFDASFVREGGTPIRGVVRRNANFVSALKVNLNASPSGSLQLPSSITIAEGQDEAEFRVSAANDNLPEGIQKITVTPQAAGFSSLSSKIDIHDSESVDLDVSLPSPLTEGDKSTFTGQVFRTGGTTADLIVNLSSSPSGQLTLPSAVTIPAGQTTASFNFKVIDDAVAEPSPQTIQITVSRTGAVSGSTFVQIFDNDFAGGSLSGWGYNEFGQVGDGSKVNRDQPVHISLDNVTSLAANGSHSLAVLSGGSVASWGYNGAGQLGDGTTSDRGFPGFVAGLSNVRAVAAGWYHSLALRGDGTVWAWGFNNLGQLGDGTTIRRPFPVQVSGLTNIVAISAGVYFSMALDSDGNVWVWGDNTYGQFGDGKAVAKSLTPVQAPVSGRIVAIAAGGGHSLFVRSDGAVLACGWNAYDQLGTGDTSDRTVPTLISEVTGAKTVSAGYVHSLALLNSGAAMAWGNNSYGQLGFGASGTGTSNNPPAIMGLNPVTHIAAGSNFSALISNDGDVYVTGSNNFGQSGRGSGSGSVLPLKVPTLSSASAIATGYGHLLSIAQLTVGPVKKSAAPPSAKGF